MKTFVRAIALATASLAAIAAQAAVTGVNVTYTGTVGSGIDSPGAFGAAGTDLTGQSYSLLYSFDIAGLTPSHLSYPGLATGTFVESASPTSTATITINGRSSTIDGSDDATLERLFVDPSFRPDSPFFLATSVANSGYANYSLTGVGSLNPIFSTLDVTRPLTYTLTADDLGSSLTRSNFTTPDFDLSLNQANVTVAAAGTAGAVPEPASWAMMVIGFGAMGGALRRRRASVAVSFS